MSTSNANTKPTGIRHAEKRRVSTCQFADRVAQCCVDHYQKYVPSSFRETQKQTCLAAIVAFIEDGDNHIYSSENPKSSNKLPKLEQNQPPQNKQTEKRCTCSRQLWVLGMGVGTKFLSQKVLEQEINTASSEEKYGNRVRDCHAEVLARRAFQRQLFLEIQRDLQPQQTGDQFASSEDSTKIPRIIERVKDGNGTIQYRLRKGVTLHMYASSAPCGNATVRFGIIAKLALLLLLYYDQAPLTILVCTCVVCAVTVY